MKNNTRTRTLISLVLAISLLSLPITAFGKKGDKNFKRGMDYEQKQQWDKAAQEYTLAVAADPSNMEYQLHFRRASFNASQTYMQQGRSVSERGDFVGAYNAFRQAYGYDPVNELAVSEMERMLRLQAVKEGRANPNGTPKETSSEGSTFTPAGAFRMCRWWKNAATSVCAARSSTCVRRPPRCPCAWSSTATGWNPSVSSTRRRSGRKKRSRTYCSCR